MRACFCACVIPTVFLLGLCAGVISAAFAGEVAGGGGAGFASVEEVEAFFLAFLGGMFTSGMRTIAMFPFFIFLSVNVRILRPSLWCQGRGYQRGNSLPGSVAAEEHRVRCEDEAKEHCYDNR